MSDKPTPGPWLRQPDNFESVISEAGPIAILNFGRGGKEAEANANLIAEAGTVYHETGLTPRELLAELNAANAEAKDALHLVEVMRKQLAAK